MENQHAAVLKQSAGNLNSKLFRCKSDEFKAMQLEKATVEKQSQQYLFNKYNNEAYKSNPRKGKKLGVSASSNTMSYFGSKSSKSNIISPGKSKPNVKA